MAQEDEIILLKKKVDMQRSLNEDLIKERNDLLRQVEVLIREVNANQVSPSKRK